MSPVVRGLRQEALHGAVEESLRVDEVHAFEARGPRESRSLWVLVVNGAEMEGKKLRFVLFFSPNSFCYRGSYFTDVAGRCWAGCPLGCFWWCLIADVVGKCRRGCCLGCCWEWCLIAEWGGVAEDAL